MWSKVLVDGDIDCEYIFRRREMVVAQSGKGKHGCEKHVSDSRMTRGPFAVGDPAGIMITGH